MADTNSTAQETNSNPAEGDSLVEACDILSHAAYIARFVQGITIRGKTDEGLNMGAGEVTGLYFVMDDLIDRIEKANEMILPSRRA